MRKILILISVLLVSKITAQFNYERTWATYYGGKNTKVLDNAIDSEGNIYIVGFMEGNASHLESYITENSFQSTFGGIVDGFIAKFNSDGLLIWSTFIGGEAEDRMNSIAIDSEDHIFIVGETSSDNMATTGAYREFRTGMRDAYLAMFNTNGLRIWSTYYGDIYNDSFSGIEYGLDDNLYLFGKTSSQNNITTPGSFQPNFIPNTAIDPTTPELDYKDFIVKFSNSGNRLWSTYYGTNLNNSHRSFVTGISINNSGVYVVGFALDTSTNSYFATTGCHQAYNSNAAGIGTDVFLSKFDFSGARLWSTYYGGALSDRSLGAGGNDFTTNFRNVKAAPNFVYFSGTTLSNNNVATPGTFQSTKQNYSNFVAKFTDDGLRMWGSYLGNDTSSAGGNGDASQFTTLNLDSDGEIFVSGSSNYNDIATSDSYQPIISSTDNTGLYHVSDAFVAKISKDGTTKYFGSYYGGHEFETGTNSILDDGDFYVIGTTRSSNNISTAGSYQESLNVDEENPTVYSENAFVTKFTQLPLKVDEFLMDSSVIYPIPNDGNFTVNLNENFIHSEITIYDMQGKVVHRQLINSIKQDLHVSNLKSGTYLIKIASQKGQVLERKLIIK